MLSVIETIWVVEPFLTVDLAHLCLMLSCLALMVQATVLDGFFDLFLFSMMAVTLLS